MVRIIRAVHDPAVDAWLELSKDDHGLDMLMAAADQGDLGAIGAWQWWVAVMPPGWAAAKQARRSRPPTL
jgi:hypothetical protein